MTKDNDLYALVRENQELTKTLKIYEGKLQKSIDVANKRINDMLGRFDWYKSEDAKALGQIKHIIQNYQGEEDGKSSN